MAIDDPTSALETQNASDERRTPPVLNIADHLLQIVGPFATGVPSMLIAGASVASKWISTRGSDNRAELVSIIAAEQQYLGKQIQRLREEDNAQKRFIDEELPGLVLDGLRRAERLRSSERVRRLGRILMNAALVGAADGADFVEEMMAIACALSDLEVRALDAAVQEHEKERTAHPQVAPRVVVADAWARLPNLLGMAISEDDLISLGSTLESFGLALKVPKELWDPPSFRPLERGAKFIGYLRAVGDSSLNL